MSRYLNIEEELVASEIRTGYPNNVEAAKKLRHDTKIGQDIKFKRAVSNKMSNHEMINVTIKGTVSKKSNHIFQLADGRWFKWTDYLIGRVY